MKKSINAYCFILIQTLAVMHCYSEFGVALSVILTIGLIIANIAFVLFIDIETCAVLEKWDEFNSDDGEKND